MFVQKESYAMAVFPPGGESVSGTNDGGCSQTVGRHGGGRLAADRSTKRLHEGQAKVVVVGVEQQQQRHCSGVKSLSQTKYMAEVNEE